MCASGKFSSLLRVFLSCSMFFLVRSERGKLLFSRHSKFPFFPISIFSHIEFCSIFLFSSFITWRCVERCVVLEQFSINTLTAFFFIPYRLSRFLSLREDFFLSTSYPCSPKSCTYQFISHAGFDWFCQNHSDWELKKKLLENFDWLTPFFFPPLRLFHILSIGFRFFVVRLFGPVI